MKCKILREDLEVNEKVLLEEFRPQTVYREVWRNGENQQALFWKIGAIVEHPQSYMLVLQGCAEPADEECARRVRRSPQQLQAAQHAYERLHAGIHPDDFDKFDAGMILGYQPDGSYIPGPNFHLLKTEEDDDE